MTAVKAFIIALVVFLVLDAIWLGFIARDLYKSHLGFLMTDSVRWGAAAIFYLLFVFGLLVFAILPALSQKSIFIAVGYGALFGLISYATYDLTNYATIRGWPFEIVVYDLIWGAVVSLVTCGVTYSVVSVWNGK